MSRPLSIALAILLCRSSALFACSSDFPNSVLGDEAVLAAPVASFADELQRICADQLPAFQAVTNSTADADLADVRAAVPDQAIVTGYVEARRVLREDAIPTDLPGEFADYLRGAIAFHDKRNADARAAWEGLLRRPDSERRYRSTWAAYMLGRLTGDPAWYVKTRELARAGFVDSLGLATASIGWQAKIELERGRLEDAMKLYLAQFAAGDASAVMSLQIVAGKLLATDGDRLRRVASDQTLQRVVTAFIVARGGQHFAAKVDAWLRAVEAGGCREVAGADRLAWAAYQAGQWETARRWVERAPISSPAGQWVQAKLLLRAGKIDAGVKLLSKLSRQFPHEDDWGGAHTAWDPESGMYVTHAGAVMVCGELGALQLARGQFAESLELLMRGGYWVDAAYVAERVLTPEELMTYVWSHEPTDNGLRAILARRLTRMGRFGEAREFVDEELREQFDAYVAGVKVGQDATLPATARAAALWSAARTAREWGLGLLSTEVDPDWHYVEGTFDLGTASRAGIKAKLTAPSASELAREAVHCAGDERRWHYRYVAAELAWEAAALLPDQATGTARILCEAGSWIKDRDPKAADRFYKALVIRCGTTDLGREADRKRWFPRLD